MKAVSALIVPTLALAVNAHFHLQSPEPRGPFVAASEPNFCDDYTHVTENRTDFPLNGGIISMNTGHPKWSAAIFISTDADPDSFDKFEQVNTFFQLEGEGDFCIPLNLASSNATGLQEGQNATIQVLFDGGDGALFQCADVTLTSDASSISCTNSTSSDSDTSGDSGSTGEDSGALGLTLNTNVLLGVLGLASLIPLMA
ncbi:hypothetical protein AGABI1DRAFT_110069 [Agaricus bisporus var. burnettii JB137-S8]|uniref:Copper acquisition factor BIM1-like domain-containing protein n=1 Tax=Agaricus bisporus var. burnettii (strain JB137-S8 / ATCC MYA-4627 / FGSC 10392) TaxID=597362 RepID=K5Y5L6_AGABU|nr:uncharacterized protein AGABI1DRAFT_110069 [Agaricus bisporus var. burnettii JB137-S8]EKM83405.1 hypothetical protein AGABI1DRAFT_110069 [Agaricus bisporus var. burnettii JB137-S8]